PAHHDLPCPPLTLPPSPPKGKGGKNRLLVSGFARRGLAASTPAAPGPAEAAREQGPRNGCPRTADCCHPGRDSGPAARTASKKAGPSVRSTPSAVLLPHPGDLPNHLPTSARRRRRSPALPCSD